MSKNDRKPKEIVKFPKPLITYEIYDEKLFPYTKFCMICEKFEKNQNNLKPCSVCFWKHVHKKCYPKEKDYFCPTDIRLRLKPVKLKKFKKTE